MNTLSFKHMPRLLVAALLTLCITPAVCRASVEPELTMAVRQKNVMRVQLLLASGVNVNERDEGAEQTPLMRAVQVKDLSLVQILLAHGAAVNAQDDTGKTALMFAVEKDDAEIVRLLLRKGADDAVRDAGAVTAADIARKHGHALVLRMVTHSRTATAAKSGKQAGDRVIALQ